MLYDGWEIDQVTKPFELSLARLRNVAVTVTPNDVPDEEGSAAIVVNFSDGTVLRFFYWRLIQDGRARLSSFDHQKRYGLPAPIDAKETISAALSEKINFTGFEIWDILFPDGTGEYSNYALE